MNANTIVALKGGTGRNQIAPIVGTAGDITTATAATMYTDTVGTTAVAALAVPIQTAIIGSAQNPDVNANPVILGPAYGRMFGAPRGSQSPYFNTASFDGVPFRVRAHGTATMGANGAQTLVMRLCLGSSATYGNNVLLGNTGAALATVAGGALVWSITAELIWSVAAVQLYGRHSATIGFGNAAGQVVSDVILSTAAPAATVANLVFSVFAIAGNAAVSSVQVKELAIETI